MGKVKEGAKRGAILLAVAGFIFSSVAVTLLYVTQGDKQDEQAKQQQELLKQLEEAQKPKQPLGGYKASKFDAKSVKKLKVETLKAGSGKAATKKSTVSANYFGWTSDGKIFDSTQKDGKATPIDFPLSGVIKGWTNGLNGVKAGSTVELTIPADQAYGSKDDGSGRPVGPLKFIVEVKSVK